MEPEVRRCPGGLTKRGNLIGYFQSPEYRRLVMIGGKLPASGETTVCWAVGVYDLNGAGKLSRPVKPVSITIPLTADLDEVPGTGPSTARLTGGPTECGCGSMTGRPWTCR
jgi:hypothetical protein